MWKDLDELIGETDKEFRNPETSKERVQEQNFGNGEDANWLGGA